MTIHFEIINGAIQNIFIFKSTEKMFILVNFGVDSRYNFKIYLRKLKESSCTIYLKACKLISLALNKKGE